MAAPSPCVSVSEASQGRDSCRVYSIRRRSGCMDCSSMASGCVCMIMVSFLLCSMMRSDYVVGAEGAQFQVGDLAGWTLPNIANVNYTLWESQQTFVVGDTLYFNYSKTLHNVMVVNKADYESCSASNPIATYDDGATVIPLDRPGTFFILCGVPSHCDLGQKVAIRVRRHASASSSTPSPSYPTPSTATSPSPIITPTLLSPIGSPPLPSSTSQRLDLHFDIINVCTIGALLLGFISI